MAITVTMRWYFPVRLNLDGAADPAQDVGDHDGDGVVDPSPVVFTGSNYNPDTMETVRVEVTVTNPVGQDATNVNYIIIENGIEYNLGFNFTLPSGKSNVLTYDTFIDRQTNQLVVPYFEQLRVEYKYGGVSQPPALSDDVTPQNEPQSGATDPTIILADSVELHGTVFGDADLDGALDVGDTGVAGVEVKLYADTGTNPGAFDATDTLLLTTTTDAAGAYHFVGLAPGDYIAQVTPANFTAGSVLENRGSSPGVVDPDNNIDDDDNGALSDGSGVVSLPIRLDYNQEPAKLLEPSIERVSVDAGGGEVAAGGFDPSISGTGRYVAFTSQATNLAAGQTDANGQSDVFLHDRTLNSVRLVSGVQGSTTNTGNGASGGAEISDNGVAVAFASGSTNLVAGQTDSNGAFDVYVFDQTTGTTRLVSGAMGSATNTSNGQSSQASISPEGRFVAFASTSTDLVASDGNGAVSDIFVVDLSTGAIEVISQAHSNPANVFGNAGSFNPSVSSNVFGRGVLVAFESDATNLLGSSATDTNGFRDIYIRDTDIVKETARVSVGVGNVQANGSSYNASISYDARFIVFESDASNLVANDTEGFRDIFLAEVNSSGNTVAIERVSVATGGAAANGASFNAQISADGRYVTFESDATNLVSGDGNGVRDIFVHDIVTRTTRRVSLDSAGAEVPAGPSFTPTISADGRVVAFASDASTLVGSDGNLARDVFAVTALAGADINATLDFAIGDVFTGTAGADTRTATDDNSELSGLDGDDVLDGAGGDDSLFGGKGEDRLTGGTGNDLLDGGTGADTADYSDATAGLTIDLNETTPQSVGSLGEDTLVRVENLIGSDFDDLLTGGTKNNALRGGAGEDHLRGALGDDKLFGEDDDDLLNGGPGNDQLHGGAGVDTATYVSATAGVKVTLGYFAYQDTGGAGTDMLSGVENLIGSIHDDQLKGDTGANVLNGGAGDDVLKGSDGADTLIGHLGADRFLYTQLSDSDGADLDRITDLEAHDVVDLRYIDADGVGNSAFVRIGNDDPFTSPGQLRLSLHGADTWLELNTDSDADAEMTVLLTGDHTGPNATDGWVL